MNRWMDVTNTFSESQRNYKNTYIFKGADLYEKFYFGTVCCSLSYVSRCRMG